MGPLRRSHAAAAALVACLLGCGARPQPGPPAHDGPIVLLTLEGLRADAVGALGGPPGLTPNLDRLAAQADWVGRAVAPSSGLGPCLASLLTGLRPWQHQVAAPGSHAELPAGLLTLAEALSDLGFSARGFHEASVVARGSGWGQGFSELAALDRGERAFAALEELAGERAFLWIHLAAPSLPYVRRDALASRLGPLPPALPLRRTAIDVEAFFDPATPLPAPERERLLALYRFNVAWADLGLGRLLRALEQSGQGESTLLAVASLYGQEFGEHGQVSSGANLGRSGIEVPLLVKLPRGSGRRIAAPPGERVAALSLWATLVEAAGGSPPPGVAPSLFRRQPGAVLSELLARGGHNELSLLEGDLQLRWQRRFSDLDASFYPTRLASLRAPRGAPARRALRQLERRLDLAYRRSLPLTGPATGAELRLERWTDGGVEAVDDPARARAMAARLRRTFLLFVGAERTPEEEALRRR